MNYWTSTVTPLDYQSLVTAERNGNPYATLCMTPTEYRARLNALLNPAGP